MLVWVLMWGAALLVGQAVRDVFVFVPGFVPWADESPGRFVNAVGLAAGLGAMAVAISVGNISVRAAAGRFIKGLGLWPASRSQALRWVAVGLVLAVVLWAMVEILLHLPGLTSLPESEDPRAIAVAQTSTVIRLCYGLIAPAPLEEFFFRGPLLALWLALLAAQRRGNWMAHQWVRWTLMGAATAASAYFFAADHAFGGSVNVAHAASLAVTTTVVTLWQRSLVPALVAHGLYDGWAFVWG